MPFRNSRSTRRHTTAHSLSTDAPRSGRRHFWNHRATTAGRVSGLKGAINNPNVTPTGRKQAKRELRGMGVKPPRERLGTKLRRWLHLGGRRESRTTRSRI